MATIPEITGRLEAATEKAENASQIMYDVANGDASTDVPTASGPTPTLKKWFQDLGSTLEPMLDGIPARLDKAFLIYQTKGDADSANLPIGQNVSAEGFDYQEGISGLEFIKPSASIGDVGSISELSSIPIPNKVCTVFVRGYYSDSDGGGGLFVWDPELSSPGNSVTIFTPVSNPTSGRWIRHVTGAITSKMAGMIGSGDESAKAQSLLDAAAAEGRSAVFTTGTYHANSLVANCPVTMEAGAKILYNGTENGVALTLPASDTTFGDLYVDGGGKNCTPVAINGNNNKIGTIVVNNVVATAAGNFSFVGVGLYGNNNSVGHIQADNFVNAGHSNGSFPQAVLSYGDGNTVDTIVCRNGRAGLVTSAASGTTTIGSLKCYGMLDNGIYQLGGILVLDDLVYHGDEEPAVFQGSGSVGGVTIVGGCIGLGFDNIGEFSIGYIHVVPDAAGNTCKFLFRTRALNISAGRLSIGKISGTLKGSSLFSISKGTFEYLEIGSMRVRFLYDAALAPSVSSWATLVSCKGFDINDMNVEIVDLNDSATGATIFQFQAPPAVSKRSFMRGLDITMYKADGTTVMPLQFLGVNFAQALIETSNVSWRTDIGPYLIARADNPMDSANAVPTSGSWVRGKRLVNSFPSAGGSEGWICVLGGTPGTWKTFGNIAS